MRTEVTANAEADVHDRGSLGLVVDKPILELLDIDRDTDLELTTDGRRLIIEPVRQRRRRVLAAAKRGMDAHHGTSRNLAK